MTELAIKEVRETVRYCHQDWNQRHTYYDLTYGCTWRSCRVCCRGTGGTSCRLEEKTGQEREKLEYAKDNESQ